MNGLRMDSGWTLLELLVVLALLGLLAWLGASGLGGSRTDPGVERELVRQLQAARARSVASGVPVPMACAELAATLQQRLGRSVALDCRPSLPQAGSTFAYFPDGSSTGGQVSWQQGGTGQALYIDWLTGTARTAAVPRPQ
jgi:general secretion pathway protein H